MQSAVASRQLSLSVRFEICWQLPGARSPRRLNFVRWRLIFVSPLYGPRFTLHFQVAPRLLNNLTPAAGLKVDKPSVILCYHMNSSGPTRPLENQIWKRVFIVYNSVQRLPSDRCLIPGGGQELFLFSTAPRPDMGATQLPNRRNAKEGGYFPGVQAAVTWNWPLHLVPRLSISADIPKRPSE
jgi:hypothetical protein